MQTTTETSEVIDLNEKLELLNHELTTIINTLPANIAMLDIKGKVVTVNEAWKQFGANNNMDKCCGLNDNYIDVCERSTGEDMESGKAMAKGLREILSGAIPAFSMEYPCHTPAEKNWWRAEVRPLADGKLSGAVVMHVNITEHVLLGQKINELNMDLEGRVTKRTAELKEANKALEAFSYSVSHDLRSPVRAVQGFTKLIRQLYGDGMNPDMKELFVYIEDSGKRMADIIEDLLKLAKCEREPMKKTEINMNDLIISVWTNLRLIAPNHAMLDLNMLPKVVADTSMMEQVITNLLSNAIKYSSKKDKPEISIWCEQDEKETIFYFKDNGVGFDMKNHDRLFGAFQRLHGMSEFEGTGVGLMLVKNIIEKHGGKVGAEGKVNEGAMFSFSLPVEHMEAIYPPI